MPSHSRSHPQHLLLLLPLGLAALLSFHGIAAKSLWLDEANSFAVARLAWPELWRAITGFWSNMGLYFVLLHFWLQFGTDEFAVRSLSAIMAIASIVPVYGLGTRLFGGNAGIIAALLLAVNAFFIRYAQEARSYSLLLFLTASASYFFLTAIDKPSVKNWALYVLVSALSMYAHIFATWMIASHFLSATVLRRGLIRKDLIASHLAIGFLVSPFLVPILRGGGHATYLSWLATPSLASLADFFGALTGYGGPVLVSIYFMVCGYGVWSGSMQQSSTQPPLTFWRYGFLLTWLFLPVLGSFLFSILLMPIFLPRYLIISLPPLVLIASAGLESLRPALLKAVTLLLLLVFAGRGLMAWYPEYGRFQNENWRAATKYVLDNSALGDGIVFQASYVRMPFEYYLETQASQSKYPQPISPSAPWGELDVNDIGKKWLSLSIQQHPRLWLVLSHAQFQKLPDSLSGWLPENLKAQYCLIQQRPFHSIRVLLFQFCP